MNRTYGRFLAGTAVGLTMGLTVSSAMADQVIADDAIVTGSICVGFDCVNGEVFSFDTLRLKENNTRIGFTDTSVGSFPANDWELTANDSASGGTNRFSITDVTGGKTPFTVEAAARTNALYVESDGDLGLGTANPVLDLHLVTGNSPGIRLDQDGSSGFSPQVWDIGGNEANFFIRDVTGGSTLPFRIAPGAASSSIHIASDGDVFLGVAPSAINSGDLVIGRTDNATIRLFDIASSTASQIRLVGATENRRIVARDADTGPADTQILLKNNSIVFAGATDLSNTWATISAAGIVTNIGSCTTGSPCDRVFDASVYTVPSIEDHAQQMWANQYLPAVGPTIQGEPVNITEKMTRILNELEHAHIYIAELNGALKVQNAKILLLEQQIAAR